MRRLIGHATSLYLALTVLAGIPMGSGATVLCLGSNGHVAIEQGIRRCADVTTPSGGMVTNSDVQVDPDGCGSCVDLPLGASAIRAGRQMSSVSTPVVSGQALLSAPSVALCSADLAARQHLGISKGALPASPSTRTPILRN